MIQITIIYAWSVRAVSFETRKPLSFYLAVIKTVFFFPRMGYNSICTIMQLYTYIRTVDMTPRLCLEDRRAFVNALRHAQKNNIY